MTTTTHPLTVRNLLFEESPAGEPASVGHVLDEREVAESVLRGMQSIPAAALKPIDHEIGSVVDSLLELDLADVLVGCWRKHRALVAAARRTVMSPGSEEVVVLAHHEATASYGPDVDLIIDGAKVKTFEFTLTLVLEVTGLAAVVRAGDLVGVHGGECEVTATLAFEGEQLVKRQGRLDPSLVVRLDRPVALIDKAAVAAAGATSEVRPPHRAG